jgi:hypothetical protein
MKASEKPIRHCRALMRHKVERVAHQVAAQYCDGGGPRTLDQMGEGGEVGLLKLVQPQGPAVSANVLA